MNAENTKPSGKLILDLPRAKYDALPGLNWSKLKIMGRSPAHFRHALMEPEPERSEALILGTALHVAVFEPEEFRSRVAVWDGGRRSGEKWQAFVEENKGRDLLTAEQADDVLTIAKAVRADGCAAKYVSGGRAEVSVTWTRTLAEFAGLPEVSIACKARLDFVATADFLVDLKSTRDASPDAFGRQCINLDYLGQAAWYADGYEAATGKRLPFVLVAVEKNAPHVVQPYVIPEDAMQMGRDRCSELVQRYALCKSESRWPGYAPDGGELDLVVPRWARPADDTDADGFGLDFSNEGA